MAPVEPPPTAWALPDPFQAAPGEDLVGVGADSAPGTMLAGYRLGLFSMELAPGLLGWYAPDPRGVLPIGGMHVSRSLQRSLKQFRISYDQAFDDVVAGCADRARPGHWITDAYLASYRELHRLGWAHSVEVWSGNQLAGGLFGVEVNGLFAGESMFHVVTDASKAAMVGVMDRLVASGGKRLFDVQWSTPHLRSLGVAELSRAEYQGALAEALLTAPAFGERGRSLG